MKVPNESLIITMDKEKVSIDRGELSLIEIDDNQTAHCDLCSTNIGAHKNVKNVYSPEQITKAVMNGLRPEKILARNVRFLQQTTNMSTADAEKELYSAWKEMAIGSETPWAVCDECKEQIEKYLNENKGVRR